MQRYRWNYQTLPRPSSNQIVTNRDTQFNDFGISRAGNPCRVGTQCGFIPMWLVCGWYVDGMWMVHSGWFIGTKSRVKSLARSGKLRTTILHWTDRPLKSRNHWIECHDSRPFGCCLGWVGFDYSSDIFALPADCNFCSIVIRVKNDSGPP